METKSESPEIRRFKEYFQFLEETLPNMDELSREDVATWCVVLLAYHHLMDKKYIELLAREAKK